jgi:hypothetical protein
LSNFGSLMNCDAFEAQSFMQFAGYRWDAVDIVAGRLPVIGEEVVRLRPDGVGLRITTRPLIAMKASRAALAEAAPDRSCNCAPTLSYQFSDGRSM